jgi:hypothetical protein
MIGSGSPDGVEESWEGGVDRIGQAATLFVIVYSRILLLARPDGRPG